MTNHLAGAQRTMRGMFARPVVIGTVMLGLASAMMSGSASADARSASANLLANAANARADLNIQAGDVVATPTLIRGMYALHDRQGDFLTFTNEPGTIFGDVRGLFVMRANGGKQRPLNENEKAELRFEMMQNVEYDKLMRVTYRDGGNRRLLMFSAVDCTYCKRYEDLLQKIGRTTATTIYVVPTSLNAIKTGGLSAWETVTRLWCAPDNGRAWQGYWQTRAVPAARQCQWTPKSAEATTNQLQYMMMSVGLDLKGVPRLVREDGYVIPLTYDYSPGFAASLGPMGQMRAEQQPQRWLTANGMPLAEEQGAYAPTGQSQQEQGQQPGKIKASDLLKKLFK